MPTVGSREFQLGYAKLTEVTRVEARGKYLGTWYPAGTELQGMVGAVSEGAMVLLEETRKIIEAQEAEIQQLKRQLAAKATKTDIAVDPKTIDAAIAAMPKQEREFFERKLGKKK